MDQTARDDSTRSGPERRRGPRTSSGALGPVLRKLGQSPTFLAASDVALAADFAVFRAPVAVAFTLLFGACERRFAVVVVLFAAPLAVLAVLLPAFPACVLVVFALLDVVRAAFTVSWVDFCRRTRWTSASP